MDGMLLRYKETEDSVGKSSSFLSAHDLLSKEVGCIFFFSYEKKKKEREKVPS